MKKLLVYIGFLLGLFSCSTDVDIYADYKEIPVVYGLIEAKADTNYVKITRAYCGSNDNPINALEVAQVYDSSNYPGKLDAYVVELKSTDEGQTYQPTGRRFFLDTLTVHNKAFGVFYAPHQLIYYTTEHFNTKQGNNKYRYRLYVVPPYHDTVTAETSVAGGNVSVSQAQISFQSTPSNAVSRLTFMSADEAVLYEIGMRFEYWESHSGQPMTKKQIEWSYEPRTLEMFEKVENTDNLYRLYYSVNTLFNLMETAIGNDTVWDADHPNVIRQMGDFTVFIAAAGEDFNNFYQFLQSTQSGLSLSTEYTNIEGGCGLFSSRIFVSNIVPLSSTTKYDLFRKPWGFQEQ